jgi:hypothetical protein
MRPWRLQMLVIPYNATTVKEPENLVNLIRQVNECRPTIICSDQGRYSLLEEFNSGKRPCIFSIQRR